MSSFESFGKIIVVLGISLTIIGGIILLLGKAGVNRLAGTLVYRFPGGMCVIPILASIVLSVLLTIVFNLIARFLNK